MEYFYGDPYLWIDDAAESISSGSWDEAQAQALTAIAIILLGWVESSRGDTAVPAAPIEYGDFTC